MNDKATILEFDSRNNFRSWLNKEHNNSDGVWILFTKGSKAFTANDALEEAICFGWIDGVMKSIDKQKYKKYFSQRKDKTNWSEKNRNIFYKLEDQGIMTKYGKEAFQYKSDSQEVENKTDVYSKNIEILKEALKSHTDVLIEFDNTAVSRQKQLAGFYCEAKTDETREKRMSKIIEAIKSKNRGMLY